MPIQRLSYSGPIKFKYDPTYLYNIREKNDDGSTSSSQETAVKPQFVRDYFLDNVGNYGLMTTDNYKQFLDGSYYRSVNTLLEAPIFYIDIKLHFYPKDKVFSLRNTVDRQFIPKGDYTFSMELIDKDNIAREYNEFDEPVDIINANVEFSMKFDITDSVMTNNIKDRLLSEFGSANLSDYKMAVEVIIDKTASWMSESKYDFDGELLTPDNEEDFYNVSRDRDALETKTDESNLYFKIRHSGAKSIIDAEHLKEYIESNPKSYKGKYFEELEFFNQ